MPARAAPRAANAVNSDCPNRHATPAMNVSESWPIQSSRGTTIQQIRWGAVRARTTRAIATTTARPASTGPVCASMPSAAAATPSPSATRSSGDTGKDGSGSPRLPSWSKEPTPTGCCSSSSRRRLLAPGCPIASSPLVRRPRPASTSSARPRPAGARRSRPRGPSTGSRQGSRRSPRPSPTACSPSAWRPRDGPRMRRSRSRGRSS